MSASFRLGPDGIYRCDAFQRFLWQEHGFGTRDGNPKVDVTLKQIHSDRVINAAASSGDAAGGEKPEADALITNRVAQSIGVRTADCVPLLLLDSKNRAIAAVHAGWRGTASEIVERTIEHLNASFGTEPADVFAAIGPCVRACCYEVGEEVARKFAKMFPEWGEEDLAKRQLDLVEGNCRQMISAGIPAGQIFDSGLCTTCQSECFYSFRREPANPGRMISAISRLA